MDIRVYLTNGDVLDFSQNDPALVQAILAEADGADYVGAGAIYATGTKDSSVLAAGTLEAICRELGCQPGDLLEYVNDGENAQSRTG